ncbi:PIN domain-containing protein [Streptomyces microflavus]
MQPVVLDTDVSSLTHKGRLTGPLATRLIGRRPLITFVTLGELTQ